MGLIAYDPYADVGLAVVGSLVAVGVVFLLAWRMWLDGEHYRKRRP